jgi:hypothetical protein
MAKEVKIFSFIDDREGREDAEKQLTDLVNDGWDIVSSGGGNAAGLLWGFIILQRPMKKKKKQRKKIDAQ